ncbi:MAG: biotin--[acetyl-CoA-carboxylase] ligase [Planctomycetaceae bacterium]|nr:biotin--[acetyl-CoA-carboxylase] ligase [Planctomycetaceae bacterium]
MPPGQLDIERVLSATTLQHVEHREETGSTNDLAIELASLGETPCPFLVIADRQTSGRGRGNNQWWAADGSLTFSLVIDADARKLARSHWPKLSLTVGLAVCQTVEALVPGGGVRLKWPNDVYLGDRKVCGVLVETLSARPETIILGVGINVNNSFREAPAELQSIATSLVDRAGREFDRSDLLVQLLVELDQLTARIQEDSDALTESFRERCMLEGRTVSIDVGNRQVSGVCHGIDEDGALLVQREGGMERCFGGIVSRIL